jgi:hypothetical protein
MGFFVQTVCDANGDVTTANRGKCFKADDYGYQFYVDIMVPRPGATNSPTKVNIVIPMGGPQSGLFRFPRIGEQVLICQDDAKGYYLIGFVPTDGDPFYRTRTAKELEGLKKTEEEQTLGYKWSQRNPLGMTASAAEPGFLEDKGMALRYRREDNKNQTGEVTRGTGEFSEIGFYNKKSKWPDKVVGADQIKEGLEEKDFSRMDVLNIQSAGDIESRAENYHLVKARRIEFLSNTHEISEEERVKNCRNGYGSWKGNSAPLADAPLDDPSLHGGEIHFRSGKRIIIKAVGEVRLQVGRTTLVVDDNGFSVVTRKVNSAVPLPNDTSFNMTPRDGISMFGEGVNIASARKFSLSDAWGAGVGSMAGMLDISGRQISQKTYDKAQQVWASVFNGLALARNMVIGGFVTDPATSNNALAITNHVFDWVKWAGDTAQTVINLRNTYDGLKTNKEKLTEKRAETVAEHQIAQMQVYHAIRDDPNVNDETKQRAASLYMANISHLNATKQTLDSTSDLLDTASRLVGADPLEMLMACLDMVLALTSAIYTVLNVEYARVWREDISGSIFKPGTTSKYNAQDKSEFRDDLNMAAMITDNSIIELVMGYLVIFSGIDIGGPASIRLRQSGDIIIKAGTEKQLYAELNQNPAVPVSIFPEKIVKNISTAAAIANLAAKLTAIPAFIEKGMMQTPPYVGTDTL